MSLFNTSIYSNFSAERLNFTPQNLRWTFPLTASQESFISSQIDSNQDEIWLFGLSLLTLGTSIKQRRFIFPSPDCDELDDAVACIADSWDAAPELLHKLANKKNVLVCIHLTYFSNLSDPRPLLLALKKISLEGPCKAIVIKDSSYSSDKVRDWTHQSLNLFLSNSGFTVDHYSDSDKNEDYFSLCFALEHYQNYLTTVGLDRRSIFSTQLYISTEDSTLGFHGGIGTYIANCKALCDDAVFAYCNRQAMLKKSDDRTLFFSDILGRTFNDQSSYSMDMVELIKTTLYALPNIKVCEFQDYLSLGFRIVQAKRSGQLPQSLHLRVLMHGSVDHIKYASQIPSASAYSVDEIKTAIRDSYLCLTNLGTN